MLRSRASAEGASAQVESPHNPERAQSPTGAQAPKARANSSVTVTTEKRTLPPKEARAPKAQAKEFSHTINKGRAPSHHRASAEGASAQVGNPHNPEHTPSSTVAQAPEARATSPVSPTTTGHAPRTPTPAPANTPAASGGRPAL